MPHTGGLSPRTRWWTTPKHLSLQRGLLVLLITALLPITVLSILQGMVRLEGRRTVIIKQLSGNAEALADSNETLLGGTKTMLQVAALNPAVQRGGEACAAVLRDIKALSSAYANVTRFAVDGSLLCAAVPPAAAYSVADTIAWRELRQSRTPLVSQAMIGPFTGKRVVMVTLPLRSAVDTFEGSIGVAIDLGWLERRLHARVTDASTGVAILSDSGQVMASSRALPRLS